MSEWGVKYRPLDSEQSALLEWFGNKRAVCILQIQRYDTCGGECSDNNVWLLFETSVGTIEHGYVHGRFGYLFLSNPEIARKLL